MDDRLGRTIETYENNAERYAANNADRTDNYDGKCHFEYYAVDEFRNHFEGGWLCVQARTE